MHGSNQTKKKQLQPDRPDAQAIHQPKKKKKEEKKRKKEKKEKKRKKRKKWWWFGHVL